MKIGHRLALRFTLVSALLTGAILIITFIITQGVVHSDFVERLAQQSRLEVIHYATPDVREVIDPESYLLINPSVSIFSSDGKLLYHQGDFQVPQNWISFLKENELFNAEFDEQSAVGRKYTYRGNSYFVFVSARDIAAEHEMDILMKSMAAGWLVSLVLSYMAGSYFSKDALKPVKKVVSGVNKITEDNLSYRLQVNNEPGNVDEIDELILTFNALLARIESAFVAQKRFLQHASHELKTPLTAIMAESELALTKDREIADYKRTLSVIVTETERLVSTTQGLLALARLEEGAYKKELQYIDVSVVCENVINGIKLRNPERSILFRQGPISFFVFGNPQLLEIALYNILDNAVKYSEQEIRIEIRKAADNVTITVVDKGIGIPKEDLEKIRSPLYRGSNVGTLPGAGLGLSLVERIIQVLKGKFEIFSEEGGGTTCVLTLPGKENNSRS